MIQNRYLFILFCGVIILQTARTAERRITTRSGHTFVSLDPIKTDATNLTVCFLYEGFIANFSWEYTLDNARVVARNKLPSISTTYVEGVVGEDAFDVVNHWIGAGICTVFVGTGTSHIDQFKELSNMYSNFYFLVINGMLNSSNSVNIGIMNYEYRFMLGYLAGRLTQTNEACFITGPFMNENITRAAANAFVVGMKVGRRDEGFGDWDNVTLHVFPTESWSNLSLCEEAWNLCKETTRGDIVMDNLFSSMIQTWVKYEILKTPNSRFIGGVSSDSILRVLIGETVLLTSLVNWEAAFFGYAWIYIVWEMAKWISLLWIC
jgi:basic membrane lipoprotein Med (substrate-binding protein (PBP1-ABC) superfamily)